jgi:hypothetical protein
MFGETEPKKPGGAWKIAAKVIVTVTILAVIFRKNDWAALGREFQNADLVWMTAAFLCMGLGLVGTSVRWDYLLKVQDIDLPVFKVWIINMIGIFFNQFLLGSTGGDVVKVLYIAKQAPRRKARAMLSVIMDRVLGLLAMLLVIALFLPLELKRLEGNHDTRLILLALGVVTAMILLGGLGVWFVPVQRLPRFCHLLWEKVPQRQVIAAVYEGFHAHGKAARPTLLALLWTVITVSAVLSTGYLISRAMHLDIGYPQMTMLFAIILCAISLPVSLSGHGVREGMFILLFNVFSVTRDGQPVGNETALACSIIFFGLNLAWGLLGGLVYLGYSHKLGTVSEPA